MSYFSVLDQKKIQNIMREGGKNPLSLETNCFFCNIGNYTMRVAPGRKKTHMFFL